MYSVYKKDEDGMVTYLVDSVSFKREVYVSRVQAEKSGSKSFGSGNFEIEVI